MAASHLLQDEGDEYNFEFAEKEIGQLPAIVNFSRREQGILAPKGNPKKIHSVSDLGRRGIRIVNRPLGTGTRLLLDGELKKAGIKGEGIQGDDREVSRHLDVGIEVLSGKADAGPQSGPFPNSWTWIFCPCPGKGRICWCSRNAFLKKGFSCCWACCTSPSPESSWKPWADMT
jgi:hypothetical protein